MISPLRKQNIVKSVMNFSSNDNMFHYQHDRGHSHLYHGYEPPRYEMTTAINTNPDYRRYDYTTESTNINSNYNYRKFNQYPQCTRKTKLVANDCGSNQCSRVTDDCCQQSSVQPSTCTEIHSTNPVADHTCPTPYSPPTPDICGCTKQTCPPISTNCNYDINCQCSTPCSTKTSCYTTICPGIYRHNNDYRRAGMATFQYYDMVPNVVVRSGNHKQLNENTSQKNGISFSDNSDFMKSYKTVYESKEYDQLHKDVTDHSKYKLQDRDYLYRTFDSSLRKRRQAEDEATLKQFWQIENFNHKNPSQLKSIRYTTFANKKYRKTRRHTESAKWLTSTEPITLKMADYAEDQEHITEKYLSFDELMHFRKNNDGYAPYDFRRKGKAAKASAQAKEENSTKAAGNTTKKATEPKTNTTKTESTPKKTTTEYTTNTPYERKKHCTRKLTCTWTAFTGDKNGDGSIHKGGPGIGPEVGSRTPPGYVEGCTRTSTCTRDYMDRNKISTIPDENSSDSTAEDEDYCERRSLNVQRRNSDDRKPTALLISYLDHTEYSITAADVSTENVFNSNIDSVTDIISNTHGCICNDKYTRKKRQGIEYSKSNEKYCCDAKNSFSYGELYYMILNKILKSSQSNKFHKNKCPCNGSSSFNPTVFSFLFMFLIHYNDI